MVTSETKLKVLTELYTRKGRLDPHDVVDEAADPEHELHELFEWDDARAGAEYRVVQARQLIRTVTIEVTTEPEKPAVTLRAFVSVEPEGTEREYVPAEIAATDADLRARVLAEMERDFLRLRRKWELHEEAFDAMVRRHVGT